MSDHREEVLRGYCLHPLANPTNCSADIVQAHTVQRRGVLDTIAEQGHVMSPKRGFENLVRNDGELVLSKHGVRGASTFMGFCGVHDDQLFSPIEKSPFILGKESAFLLSFRAICYERFMKDAGLRVIEIQREGDRGDPFNVQCAKQQFLYIMGEGLKRGLQGMNRLKAQYDTAFVNRNYNDFSFYVVTFSTTLPIVACGAFYPQFDFRGNPLQDLTRGDFFYEHVSFNVTIVHNRSVAVLGWIRSTHSAAEQFIQSFQALPKEIMANAAFFLACEHLENIYLRPSWWDAQPEEIKAHLITRFRSGLIETERNADCLSRIEHKLIAANVDCELDS